jgi:hypothetical protein
MTSYRTGKELEEWIEEFKRRNGLDKALPTPPEGVKPPRPATEVDDEKHSEEGT